MNKKLTILAALALGLLTLGLQPAAGASPPTISYGDVTLNDSNTFVKFPHFWDLTACDVTLSFTYDLSGAQPPAMWQTSWSAVGLRNDAAPWGATWLSAGFPAAYLDNENDYDYTGDGVPDPNLDLDDKLNLGRWPNLNFWDEREYDMDAPESFVSGSGGPLGQLPSPYNPWYNYGIWFDRDGVDPWQAADPLAVNGGTYNTGGIYNAVLTYHAVSGYTNVGSVFAAVNNIPTGFHNGTSIVSPFGQSFQADLTRMQVYAGVTTPSYGPIEVENIEVTGCLWTMPVDIDIKPGSDPNSINPKSRGKIPVAILSTPDFDAPGEVDEDSLTFGATGDEESLAKCTKSAEDVNDDGLLDLVCHFYTQDTGFQSGDTEGILRGETNDGQPIEGHDSVRIVN